MDEKQINEGYFKDPFKNAFEKPTSDNVQVINQSDTSQPISPILLKARRLRSVSFILGSFGVVSFFLLFIFLMLAGIFADQGGVVLVFFIIPIMGGCIVLAFPCAIIAIIFGLRALKFFNKDKGRGLCFLAIFISFVSMIIPIVLFFLLGNKL